MLIFSEKIITSHNSTQSFIVTKFPKATIKFNYNLNTSSSLVAHYCLSCSHPRTSSPLSDQHLPPFLCVFFYSTNPQTHD